MTASKSYVRTASGLVRAWSPWDLLIYNTLASAVIFGSVTFSLFGETLGSFPGANPYLGIVIAALGAIPVMAMYALLSSAMPRSGGDYVWVSRIVHPSIAFAYSTVFVTTAVTLYMAWNGWVLAYVGFSSVFGILGRVTGSATYSDLAIWFLGNGPVLLISFIGIAGAAILTISGMRKIAIAQRIWLVIITGLFLAFVIILGLTSKDQFINSFNNFFNYLGPNTYRQVIETASVPAAWPSTFSWRDTIVWASYTEGLFLASWWGAPMMGEIKSTENLRNMTIAMCFPAIFNMVEFLALTAVSGNDRLGFLSFPKGASWVAANEMVVQMPFKPYFIHFVVNSCCRESGLSLCVDRCRDGVPCLHNMDIQYSQHSESVSISFCPVF